mmetsp:Transcript_4905/g.9181  ORF Transcript_4905/g.9181 Transcript_4905/m.9181 type:complete len:575 (-) Transcript_4905:1982-3706(-)
MQSLQPQLRRSSNPMERQITYSSNPLMSSRAPTDAEPYFTHITLDSSVEASDESLTEMSDDKDELIPIVPEASSKRLALRASTAPARPLTDIEEFRRSSDFLLLEHTVICASQLIQRTDAKYDLDSEEGQRACIKFLNQVERLCEVFKASCVSRSYRNEFSKAYRVLYKEGSLCYLTEILDAAQEGVPYLWVNGEKYVFSNEVLEAGSRLFSSFYRIQHVLREIYNRVCEETVPGIVSQVISDLSASLQEFDAHWVDYEQLYILELMLIEGDARRYITEAIEIEREIVLMEVKEKAKGRVVLDNDTYHTLRSRLVNVIGRINSVANIEGKGRDDLSSDILVAAEGLTRRMATVQSKAVRNLAERIRQAFTALRLLFRRYDQNIELVDPQLKNNPELVEALNNFEITWEKGKTYFLSSKRCAQLMHFSQLIENMCEKHATFREQLECRDAEMFITIPALLVLRCLEDDDKGICKHFYTHMFDESLRSGLIWKHLKRAYTLGKLAAYSASDYCCMLESAVLGQRLDPKTRMHMLSQKFDNLDSVLHKIKLLASELHRSKPTEWNRFLDVALVSVDS